MTQFRLIVMHPQLNATFTRRLIGIGDTLKTTIECHSSVANTLAALSPNQNVSLIIPKSQLNLEISDLCDKLQVPVVAWDFEPEFSSFADKANRWHCIGDPFSSGNYQSALFLVTKTCEKHSMNLRAQDVHSPQLDYWMNRRKWGDLHFEFSGDCYHSILEFRNILKKLKSSNHQNTQIWQSLIESHFSSVQQHATTHLKMNCDGNRVKMYWDVPFSNQHAFEALIQNAKKLRDSTALFEAVDSKIRIFSEISVSDIDNSCQAIVVWGVFTNETIKSQAKLEDAG